MRTALDTNIISALLSNEVIAPLIAEELGHRRRSGPVVISPVVYAELLAYPGITEAFVDHFLATTGIQIDYNLDISVWRESGRRFARYAARRRLTIKLGPKRLLADFMIGAHALVHADCLMTYDTSRFKQDFPDLRLATPAPA